MMMMIATWLAVIGSLTTMAEATMTASPPPLPPAQVGAKTTNGVSEPLSTSSVAAVTTAAPDRGR